jgi:hypothetical protein
VPKIQDLLFVLVLILLFWRRNLRLAVGAGIACLLLAMPLFGFKIRLFTAERLTIYAATFFLLAILQKTYAYRH